MELLLEVDRGSREPLHAQIERELREAIRAGRLTAGTPLPSSRSLARELDVSRGVVVEAYSQLLAEGYIAGRERSRTRVTNAARPAAHATPADPAQPPSEFDFHPGMPDVTAFPSNEWLRSLRRALREKPTDALAYPDPRGAPELRTALAHYLARARGVVSGPERILVCTGLMQGVALVARALVARGERRIALEDPGFSFHREIVRRAGLEPVPVQVDEDGISVTRLRRAAVRSVLVTPAHQSPTGCVLRPERRTALLEWAEQRDGLVIEDDYDAEYRYDREPVGALQSLASERVVYAGSASKVLAPGLRLGWLVAPTWLTEALAAEKALDDAGTSLPEQLAFADLISRGGLDRHLRRMRTRYRRRRQTLLEAVSRQLPTADVRGAAAGLHALLLLPEGTDEAALIQEALLRGVAVHGLSWHRFDPGAGPPGLILGYAGLAEAEIERGIERVGQAYRSLGRGSPRNRSSLASAAATHEQSEADRRRR